MRACVLGIFATILASCGAPVAPVAADAAVETTDGADAAVADSQPDVAPDVVAADAPDSAADPDATCVCADGTLCADHLDGQCPVATYPTLCMPCANDAECQTAGSRCLPIVVDGASSGTSFSNGAFCLTACTLGGSGGCKSGFTCKTVSLGKDATPATLCTPDSGDCSCHDSWAMEGKSTACSHTSPDGKCTGKRMCSYDAQTNKTVLTACDAATPATEVCGDNVDNDCNGLTDEAGAEGCSNYCLDKDGDGFGVPPVACLCWGDADIGYSLMCNDCDDTNPNVYPKVEICNGIDDNCNGLTDEAGAKGCTLYCHFGDPADTACICPSIVTPEWVSCSACALKAEICDGIDNNCNGETDEPGAIGCKLFYIDKDGDGYGVASSGLCLCGPSKSNTASQPGDCDDSDAAINPGADEICDGVDNDCNGKTDDGTASQGCPGGCVGGSCSGACPSGFVDLNASATDGCECAIAASTGGGSCGGATILGDLPSGATLTASGQILPGETSHWYSFHAADALTTGPQGSCNAFDLHIDFPQNPGQAFAFDVYRGSCGAADKVCSGETLHDESVDFFGSWGGKSNVGQCPCTPAGPGAMPLPGVNVCSDWSATYFVRVHHQPGAPFLCASYTVQFTQVAQGSPPFP